MRKIIITGLFLLMVLLFAACDSTEEFLNEAVREDTVITETQDKNA